MRYGRRPALGPLDLRISAGERLALVGPSGCGKSTALRLLAGLEPRTAGAVRRELAARETAVVFQAPTLAPWATALDNVALPLRLAGSAEAATRAADALRQVGLEGAERLKPAQLSGGMAMRVSLARALVMRPRLLLLDEPFAALDELTRRRLAEDVLALHARRAAEGAPLSLVLVTHHVDEALLVGARVLALTPGPGRVAGEVDAAAPDAAAALRALLAAAG